MRRLLCPSALALALALAAPIVFAQSGGKADAERPLDDALQGVAKDAYASAKILISNGDFAGAATKFAQAYDLSKDPRLLFNLAICEKNLRHYARTKSLLEAYEHDLGTRITADDKTTVDAALAAIRNFVGAVRVTVTEPGAVVLVDGQPAGTTPLASPLSLDLGKHTIGVKKDGFASSEQVVDVTGGGEAAIAVTLEPEAHTAHLLVLADPETTVTIDEKVVGKGRFDGSVASGTHAMLVSEPGKVPYRAEIDLKDGETRSVSVTLESEKQGTLWPWIVGGAVAAAGAAVGGYFLFRTEPQAAPRPPDQLGSVQLMRWRQ